jgi:hypothetical protein
MQDVNESTLLFFACFYVVDFTVFLFTKNLKICSYSTVTVRFKVDEFVARYPGALENARQAMKKHHKGISTNVTNSVSKPPAKKSKKSTTK